MKYVFLTVMLVYMTEPNAKIHYPQTPQKEHTDVYYGQSVQDPYQWLEDDNSLESKEWVQTENKLTQDYLSKISFRSQIKNRLEALNDYEKVGSFFRAGKLLIFRKNTGLQNQSIWMYKVGLDGDENVLLDPNQYDSDGTTTFEFIGYSESLNIVAVAISKAGSDWQTIKVFDLTKMQFLQDELQWVKFSGADWYQDGFYYGRYPEPETGKELSATSEFQSIYYHKIGTQQNEDLLIYQDIEQPRNYHSVESTDDKAFQILYKTSGTDGFETLYRKLGDDYKQIDTFQYLFKGFKHKSRVIDHLNGRFLIMTDINAPNYQVVLVDPNQNSPKQWKIIIPEQKSVMTDVFVIKDRILIEYLENAHSVIKIYDLEGHYIKDVSIPGLGTVAVTYFKKSDPEFFYSFSSFTQPETSFQYNVDNDEKKPLAISKLPFQVDNYQSEQVWYPSKDGTAIPMFLVYKKGLERTSKNPTYLYAYGGFNISLTPSFSTSYISLLEQGVLIAIPNIRGGGEFGENWHQAGMLMDKQNVFDDFIAAAEYLISNHYTSSKKLAIAGASNGGLLVGACMTQRPDLFQVALPAVGVMDMLKFQNFTVGWGWVPEYGSSDQSKEMFEYLYHYSPYHNIRKGVNYPATLVTTADHDDRVVPAHSFKFIARLQSYTKNKRPALIRIETQAGHGAGKPISKIIDEVADKWTFFLWNVGLKRLK